MAITGTSPGAADTAAQRQALLDQLNGNRTPGAGAGSGSAATGAGNADQQTDRFLKLLVAQMSHQDPLNPLDNAQVTSQMAQISTVEGIGKLNAAIASLVDQSSGLRAVDAAGLIGKNALVEGSQLGLAEGHARGAIELKDDAAKVQVQVLDAGGTVVRTMDMANVAKGVIPVSWDGKSDAGTTLPDGAYSMRAVANPGTGQTALTSLTAVRVTAVVGDRANLRLELEGQGLRRQDEIKGYL